MINWWFCLCTPSFILIREVFICIILCLISIKLIWHINTNVNSTYIIWDWKPDPIRNRNIQYIFLLTFHNTQRTIFVEQNRTQKSFNTKQSSFSLYMIARRIYYNNLKICLTRNICLGYYVFRIRRFEEHSKRYVVQNVSKILFIIVDEILLYLHLLYFFFLSVI